MLDENSPLKMIHFVLQADGEQAVGGNRLLLAIRIEVAHDDMLRPLDLVVDARHRQAALFANLDAVALDQFGIDQHQELITGF